MKEQPIITLEVNNHLFTGFQSISIQKSMHAMSGEFQLGLSSIESRDQESFAVNDGDACQVLVGNAPVITGYIDQIAYNFGVASSSVEVSGRDQTADLVDCSSTPPLRQWNGSSLEKIAKDLCEPFQISVEAHGVNPEPFEYWVIHEDEKIGENLQRAAALKRVALFSDGQGKLNIFSPARVSQKQTKEVTRFLDATFTTASRARFSDYILYVKASQLAGESSYLHPPKPKTYSDSSIQRKRTLAVSTPYSKKSDSKASWEISTRIAKSKRISLSLPNWSLENGEVLELGDLLTLKLDQVYIENLESWMVTALHFTLSENSGPLTRVELELPGAYKADPTMENYDFRLKQLFENEVRQIPHV